MRKTLALISIVALASGCTMLKTNQTDTTQEGLVTKTSVMVYSILGGKSDLSKLRTTSTEKTQGVAIGVLAQESTGTNIIAVLQALEGIVQSAAGAVK